MKVPPIATVDHALARHERALAALAIARTASLADASASALATFELCYIAEWRARDELRDALDYERRRVSE